MSSLLPILGVSACHLDDANRLLEMWRHPLGPCERPFRSDAWTFDLEGEPIACAISASTVSATVAGIPRQEVVELARIARHPEHPFILRVMLRLWRVYLARSWPLWNVGTAVSYAIPGTPGDLYRFDGWERIGQMKRSQGGGTWTKPDPAASLIGDGKKTLWVYRYGKENG